jgi:hypothetical protein
MMQNISRCFLLVSMGLLYVGVVPAHAQWASDSATNTVVCDTTGQRDSPQACSDGANGAVIVWEDGRTGDLAIYAQHLNANGYPTWTKNGVKLAQSNSTQQFPIMASDGSGGAYVVWQDDRNSSTDGIDLYGQHILANGTLGYSSAGIAIVTATGSQDNAVICADGQGNAYVAWEDNRNPVASSQPDIYCNRMTSGGVSFGQSGTVVDALINRQVGPSICEDGTGGCYIAWEDEGKTPTAIYGRRIGSDGTMLWGQPPPAPGVLLYEALPTANNPQPNSSNVSLSLDNGQLLFAWEVTNASSPEDGQDILAQRMNCATTSDTSPVYTVGSIPVTGGWLNDQISPQIFSDDSLFSNSSFSERGILVPFLDYEPGSIDNVDVAMVRVLGDGMTTMPPAGTGFFDLEQQPNARTGFKAIHITDNDPSKNGILAVWNDSRYAGLGYGKDTTVFAQRIDRNGHNYFPATGSTKLAQPVCSSPDVGGWEAKQVALAPRTDGGIAVWTDFRRGNNYPNIYAQIILMYDSLWIPEDTTTPTLTVQSTTPPDNGSPCNSQCTTVLAIDPGTFVNAQNLVSGFDSLIPEAFVNMELDSMGYKKGEDSVTFSVCVIDSFQDASGTVKVEDTAENKQTMSFAFCTIPDTSAPLVTVDTLTNPYWFGIHVRDDRPWDRGLSAVVFTDTTNVSFSKQTRKFVPGEGAFDDTVTIIDPSLVANFCVMAMDTAGNASAAYCFTTNTSGVSQPIANPISLSVFPNPTSGDATLSLTGAQAADVTILDVLGRMIAQFHLEGSYQWQASTLPAGTYIVRAVIGDQVVCKRIVRE